MIMKIHKQNRRMTTRFEKIQISFFFCIKLKEIDYKLNYKIEIK